MSMMGLLVVGDRVHERRLRCDADSRDLEESATRGLFFGVAEAVPGRNAIRFVRRLRE